MDKVQIRTGGRSAHVKERVFQALREVLESGDPEALSVPELSRRSGVHKTTIYSRWTSSSGALADLLTGLTPLSPPLPDTGDLREDLTAVADRVSRTLASTFTQSLLRLLAGSTDRTLASAATVYWESVFERTAEVVRRAQRRGDALPEVDPVAAIETLLAPLYLRLLVTHRPIDAAFIEGAVDRTVRLLNPSTAATPDVATR